MIRSIAQLKAWFRRGKYPTEEQFADWFDSYVHKDESRIPISQVDNLPEQLNGKYNASDGKLLERKQNELRQEFDSHKQDAEDEFEKIENNRQALVAEDGRLQGEIDTTNTNLEHLRKRLHPTAVFDSLENTFSALGANYSTLWALANTLKTFLEAKDTADSTINRWQEIEAFLQGITDAETLSGLLEQLEKDITAAYGKTISEAVKTETDRANGVETTLQANIDKERERAEEAEAGIKRYVDDNVGNNSYNSFYLEGFDFNTATQKKKEDFIKWIKGVNQIAHIVLDTEIGIDDLFIPISSYRSIDGGSGEDITLDFISINASDLNIRATIQINAYNSNSGIVDINSTVSICIKRYNIYPDYTKHTIVTSDNLTAITKKTGAEYEALTTKDANTMYAVVD